MWIFFIINIIFITNTYNFWSYKYFKSKLYLRSDKLDPLILENILKPKLPVNLLSQIISLTKTCDANRFSPGSNKKAKDLKIEINKLLKEIDRAL